MLRIRKQVVVDQSVEQVWHRWTTVEGVRSFLAPDASIELVVGGAYEMYFALSLPEGQRGSEGCRVLHIDKPHRLEFSWNFPPNLPEIRQEQTQVTVSLFEMEEGRCRVDLVQEGFKDEPIWQQGLQYFLGAWDMVLERLARQATSGPIDWNAPWKASRTYDV